MSELLFDIPETLSPKLVWMRKHGVEIFQPASEWIGLTVPETGETVQAWVCKGAGVSAGGATGDDAIFDWCEKSGVKHWTVE